MNFLTFPGFGSLNAGLLVSAAIAALTALAPQAQAAQSAAGFDRPASYDIRDQRSSGPVGAVEVTRTAKSSRIDAREARCDIRDVCSTTPPVAVKPAAERADASARNPACDVRDVCTSNGVSLTKADPALRLARDRTAGAIAQ